MNADQLSKLINPNVRDLSAYHLKPENFPVKLNQNENPFDWPQYIKDEVAEFCRTRAWNRYPNFIPDDLKQTLADFTGLTPNNVIVGNGSNEMLLILLLSLTKPESPVIICQPTFTVYQLLSRGLGRTLHEVFANDDLSYNVERITKASKEAPDSLIILCSPNNPTGTALTEKEIRHICESHQGFFILDQAYVEFGGYSALPLLKEYPNLIITRTFSKAFRGAGMRIGYLLGTVEIVQEINKIKLPYNINFFTEQVAMVLLAHHREMENSIKIILEEQKSLVDFLNTLPFDAVYPSEANFICLKTGKKEALFSAFKENGILVRDVSSYPMLKDCLRITVGTPEENALVKQTLITFFNGTE